MEYKNIYHILGVNRSADDKDAHKALRRLTQQSYPAKNQANTQNQKKTPKSPQAYERLGQPGNRTTDDPSGRRDQQDSQLGGSPGDFDYSPKPWAMAAGPRREKPLDFGGLFGSRQRATRGFGRSNPGSAFPNDRPQDSLVGLHPPTNNREQFVNQL